jgi:peroxiredoxin Q/BCP
MRSLSVAVILAACLLVAATGEAGLKVGDRAPEFALPAATRDSILSAKAGPADYAGKRVVILAFYPADWSGGCTKEMCTLRDNFTDLGTLGAVVLGISGDYVYSHREWARALDLPFTLLSDHNHAVARTYESIAEGRDQNLRTIYVIDTRGLIAYIDPAYKAGTPESFDALRQALKSIH